MLQLILTICEDAHIPKSYIALHHPDRHHQEAGEEKRTSTTNKETSGMVKMVSALALFVAQVCEVPFALCYYCYDTKYLAAFTYWQNHVTPAKVAMPPSEEEGF